MSNGDSVVPIEVAPAPAPAVKVVPLQVTLTAVCHPNGQMAGVQVNCNAETKSSLALMLGLALQALANGLAEDERQQPQRVMIADRVPNMPQRRA